ncbi:uncharacterized protein LOC134468010 [Engraulis encrasicolus]|uniref:uncharacterized protein LOC134468010 n=1 Tax=Engraulis encrasicolus TaxID=184585 RepID=UPI002FD4D136
MSNVRMNFVWTDDEVELLLNVTLDFKTSKAAQGVDFELVHTKYGDIMDLFLENYPSPEDASASGKEFPHQTKEITKGILTAKVKAIRNKFKHAVAAGRRTGYGRAVQLFYGLCKTIWGGGEGGGESGAAPGTCSPLPGGIEMLDQRADLYGRVEVASGSASSEDEGRSQVPSALRAGQVWTDDEVELLLNVTLDYKTSMAAEKVEWETVHTKYADITDLFFENYPSPEDASASGKEFPHTTEEITKAQVMSKVKSIRHKFRLAMATGRKRGCGRVILLFYDLCKAIWGGGEGGGESGAAPHSCSPLPGGMKTSDQRAELRGRVEKADRQKADVSAELMSPIASDSADSEDEGRSQVPGNSKKSLVWTDDEVELLLNVTLDYKKSMAAHDVEWESVQRRYEDITDLFLKKYPSPEDASASRKDFPHAMDEITKGHVSSKVKAIRNKFRLAMASGRKTRYGRAVLVFYDLCDDIWGVGGRKLSAAPVTCSPLPGGIETSDLRADLHGRMEKADRPAAESDVRVEELKSPMPSDSAVSEDDEGRSQVPSAPSITRLRHRHIDTTHRGITSTAPRLSHSHRPGHVRKKPLLPMGIAQEELELKRRMFKHLEVTDRQFLSTMNRLTASVERISSDFRMLVRHMMGSSSHGRPQSPHRHNGLRDNFQNDTHDDLQNAAPAVVAPLFGFTHRVEEAEGNGKRHPRQHARQEEEPSTSDTEWVPPRLLRTKPKDYQQNDRRLKRKGSSTTSPPQQQQPTPRQEEAPPTSDSQVDVDQVLLRLRTARKEVPEKIFAVRLGGKGGDEMAVSADAPEPPAKLLKQELDNTDQGEEL